MRHQGDVVNREAELERGSYPNRYQGYIHASVTIPNPSQGVSTSINRVSQECLCNLRSLIPYPADFSIVKVAERPASRCVYRSNGHIRLNGKVSSDRDGISRSRCGFRIIRILVQRRSIYNCPCHCIRCTDRVRVRTQRYGSQS